MSEPTAADLPLASPVRVRLDYFSRVNLALQHNDVPLVSRFEVVNESTDLLTDLTIALRVEPGLSPPRMVRLERLEPGTSWTHGHLDLQLPVEHLVNVTEREAAQLVVTVSAGATLLTETRHPLEVLAYNEWAGNTSLPEILAAFVQPNHPALADVLAEARRLLDTRTGDAALQGYQSGQRARVAAMAEALYDALQKRGITYMNPPASFETSGQKIRTADQVLEDGSGTCLDLTTLMAALLEAAGLHPLVLLVEGHAFPGVWLDETCFAEAVESEPVQLRKRIELGEMLVWDSSAVAQGRTFRQAVGFGQAHLQDVDAFRYAVDVHTARTHRIRPLPSRLRSGAYAAVTEVRVKETDPLQNLLARGPAPTLVTEEPEPLADRLERWKGRLLDLTLHNRFLNFKDTRKTLELLCADVARLEDLLASGRELQLLAKPGVLGGNDPRSAAVHREREGDDLLQQFLRERLAQGALHSAQPEGETSKRLTELFRSAKSDLEETGANTLFLTLGMLHWYEANGAEQPRRAPILLVPVELVRAGGRGSYRLRLREEDARINVTLLQKLDAGYGIKVHGVHELPGDESGVDVQAILDAFRRAVVSVNRWEVREEVHLGLFSFTKYLMWRDLHERLPELQASPIVRGLLGLEAEIAPVAFPGEAALDAEWPAEKVFCPLPADGSQLGAVLAAADGGSFVLQGPPGTGKSQTITNLIAHLVGSGKSVLFVSEKRAALEVVHNRLSAIGLGPFTLELHSNKVSKTEVYRQFREVLEFTGTRSGGQWEERVRRLQAERLALNGYVEALHRRQACGLSLHDAFDGLVELREVTRVPLRLPAVLGTDSARLAAMRVAAADLAAAAAPVEPVHENVWRHCAATAWTPEWRDGVLSALERTAETAAALERDGAAVLEAVGAPAGPGTLAQYEALDGTAALLRSDDVATPGVISSPEWSEQKAELEDWIAHGRRRVAGWQELERRHQDSVLALEHDALIARLERWGSAFVLVAFFMLWGVRRALKRTLKPGATLGSYAEQTATLEQARAVAAEDAYLTGLGARPGALLGLRWKGKDTDWDRLERSLAWNDAWRSRLGELERHWGAGGPEVRGALLRLVTERRDLLEDGGAVAAALDRFRASYAAHLQTRAELDGLLALEPEAWQVEAPYPAAVRARVETWRGAVGQLREWTAFRQRAQACLDLGLGRLVEAHRTGALAGQSLPQVFERSFLEDLSEAMLAADQSLGGFLSSAHEERIRRFRALDREVQDLAAREVVSRLAATAMRAASVGVGQPQVLRRQLQLQRRQMPVRKLFQEIPQLVRAIKPCVLMSPLSVAQFLDASSERFDVVVFDEASQIPPWDGVGAIARADRAVIVGDSRQLPPTTFFQVQEEGDEEVEQDLESILDEARVCLPEHTLRWHYRSRHEDLIAFSNRHYYENRLMTFPSAGAQVDGLGVSWRHLSGAVYDRGRSQTNQVEAQEVVAEIVRRLRSDRAHESIGVVTFSVKQQRLIEDLLDEALMADPVLQSKVEASAEPIFVKNLENVQGDERDVMLFSICYGPDAQGHVYMNFGPLNRDGGERRLNVAVTRARRELVVFSALRPEQIDLSRTRATGAAHLKAFLEYAAAAGGGTWMAGGTAGPDAGAVVQQLEARLEVEGWDVHPQVGRSDYRVDLAVCDPDDPGRYLLGIECDGANYRSAACARDRERIRAEVLGSLGWRLHRVWSADWWAHPERELERLLAAIQAARDEAAKSGSDEPVQPAAAVGQAAADAPAPDLGTGSQQTGPAVERFMRAGPQPAAASRQIHERYIPAGPPPGSRRSAQYLEEPRWDAVVRNDVRAVVETEGPVSLQVAAQRLASWWGLNRATERVRRRVMEAAHGYRLIDGFLWPAKLSPDTWRGARDGGDRKIEEIAVEELANAAELLLKECYGLPEPELLRETARRFGIQRMGARVEARLQLAVERLIKAGRATERGGQIVVP